MLETILFFATIIILLPATGFFLTLAFFPQKQELSLFERIVFSAILGIIFPALLLLAENQVFGIPINFTSATTTIIALVFASLLAFYYRKNAAKLLSKT